MQTRAGTSGENYAFQLSVPRYSVGLDGRASIEFSGNGVKACRRCDQGALYNTA
jgi:hypothetical protein